ncbi:hypothetical protein ACJMK2_011616 [Sinanodonta woodiana]|uniref:OB domain-containing protein n=1 Tax=Sinanodonta woodiana TaxID=1069815 RepID=A0ABD3V5L3_SINWO
MSTPQRFKDLEYRNWVKCSLSLIVMKEGLHDYVDTEVKKLHLHIKTNLSSTPGGPSFGTLCGSCTWKDVRRNRGYHNTSNIICRNRVCDRWLSQILAFHNEPNNPNINWKNADISQWPTNPYEIAKVYMPKGQDRTHNLPQELDAAAILSLLKYCKWFGKNIPNIQLLSDLIDFRNEVLHSGELKVKDSIKDIRIDQMIKLLSDLKVNGDAQSELNRVKCEDIDMSFRENEIQALQNLVSGLRSKLAEVTGEMASLQNVQTQHSEETTKHAEEVNKSLQELKEISDKMETFLNNNPDINDIEITKSMKDFKKDIQEELSQIKLKVLSHDDRLETLDDRLEKHKEETQLQFKGVRNQLAALENKSGNDLQPIHQKVSGGATASSSSDVCVDYISSLRPYQKRWKICSRITNKSRIIHYRKPGKKWDKHLNLTFTDSTGSINAVAFGQTAEKFNALLKEQKVYYVSNATIKQDKMMGRNAYNMILTDDTNIKLYEEEDSLALPTQIPFKSVTIDKLEPGQFYDVIGVVKDHREKTVKKWHGIDVQIVDQSKKIVSLNLSKKDVEKLDLRGNPILAVSGACLKHSYGHVYLKMMPNSKLQVNPADIPETDLLKRWFEKEGRQIEFEKI